jgi:fatty acyl-CoA reductase
MVASAIIAAAANGPQPEPEVFQIASGSTNPLLFKVLLDTAMEWFGENPVYNADGHPTAGTEWKYAGSQGLEEQLKRVVKAFDVAGKVINRLPIRGEKSFTSKFAERRRNLAQIQGYVEIYGAYGKCEALYGIDKTLELWDSLSDQDRAEFGFDPRVIDWHHYITEVHLPTVMIQARVKTTPEKKVGPSRKDRLTEAVLNEKREFAAFDLENTLIASNVVASYAWMATRHLDRQQRLRFTLKTLAQSPGLWRRDKRDRTDFLRFFYQRYKGAPVAQLEDAAAEMLSNLILTKSFPAGLRRVRAHRAAGHKTILITGALDIAVEPLRPLFDHIVAAEIAQKDGLLTGEMAKVPPTGEVRAQLMLEWAAREGLDPSQGVAYADSASDLPMLEAVGYPVAVNPETRLVAIAEKRGWLTENWPKTPGAPNSILPMGPKAQRVTNQRGNN